MNHNFSENLAKLCRTAGRPERWGRSQPFRLGLEKSTSRRLTPAPLLWWAEGEETLTAIPPACATSIRGQTRRATQAYTNDTAPYGEQSIAAKGGQKRSRGPEAAGVAPHRSRLLASRLNNTSPLMRGPTTNPVPPCSSALGLHVPDPPPGITVVRFTIHSSRLTVVVGSRIPVHSSRPFPIHDSRITVHHSRAFPVPVAPLPAVLHSSA